MPGTVGDADFPLTKVETFTLANLPAASDWKYRVVHCSNGNAGNPCLAFSDGTNWKVVALGATVS